MTLKSAEEIILKWQKRLRLQDWEIRLSTKPDLGAKVWGQCLVWKNKLIAEIEIALPEMLAADNEAPPLDELLVHELLHVVLVNHELGIDTNDDNPPHKHYERGIDRIAKALVEGYEDGSK